MVDTLVSEQADGVPVSGHSTTSGTDAVRTGHGQVQMNSEMPGPASAVSAGPCVGGEW